MTDTFDEPRRPTLPPPANYASDVKRRDELVRRIELQVRLHGGLTAALSNLAIDELERLLEKLRERKS